MSNVWRNLRFALRALRSNPGFTAVAVMTLGLGIAANTTVFGWVDTILLWPIPGVRNAHELTALEGVGPEGARLGAFPHPDFRDFQRQMTQASGVVAAHTAFFTIGPPDHPQRALGQVVSANFFSVLGVEPFLGRMLAPEEDRDTPGAFPYAVISHRLWRTYFREDTGVVGRAVRINRAPVYSGRRRPAGFRRNYRWRGAGCLGTVEHDHSDRDAEYVGRFRQECAVPRRDRASEARSYDRAGSG